MRAPKCPGELGSWFAAGCGAVNNLHSSGKMEVIFLNYLQALILVSLGPFCRIICVFMNANCLVKNEPWNELLFPLRHSQDPGPHQVPNPHHI